MIYYYGRKACLRDGECAPITTNQSESSTGTQILESLNTGTREGTIPGSTSSYTGATIAAARRNVVKRPAYILLS